MSKSSLSLNYRCEERGVLKELAGLPGLGWAVRRGCPEGSGVVRAVEPLMAPGFCH